MRIALDEIDPHIAAMYAVTAPAHTTRTTTTRRPRLSRRRRLALAAAMVVPPMVGLQLGTLFSDHSTGSMMPYGILFGTWILGSGLGCRAALKGQTISREAMPVLSFIALVIPLIGFFMAASTTRGVSNGFLLLYLMISLPIALAGNRILLSAASHAATVTELQTENMRDVFTTLSLTRAERVYCDVLMFLARAQPNAATEQTMRATLGQLNDLIESSRQLEEQRLALLPLLGANVVPELRAEFDRLNQRMEAASDPITRASLEQSRRMVVSRIEDAHNLQTGLERLNTQQEAVTQTLSSALSSLGRMQITSSPNAEFAMNDIAESVTQMNQQTTSVESAVEEVLTLRASN